MHELSLAQNLIDQIVELAGEHGADKILKVVVGIGPFSGIVAESFSFGFNALKQEKVLTRAAILELDEPAPEYRCRACQHITTIRSDSPATMAMVAAQMMTDRRCPSCNTAALSPWGGNELLLKTIEME
ncbi:MAG: hypothetical protein CSA21_03290 [Deltaproteobacteria bacterium]|nr:MAG: hypothetical protein CSA21_03290 [Deltaproteobacteria bacterium]